MLKVLDINRLIHLLLDRSAFLLLELMNLSFFKEVDLLNLISICLARVLVLHVVASHDVVHPCHCEEEDQVNGDKH